MERIQFAVSAKTARLIGRENISDVDGAVVELIKNSYDADASCVFVCFDIPFPAVPQEISFELAASVFDETGLAQLLNYYVNDGICFAKKKNLSSTEERKLNDYLFSYNTIIVMDNGCGMNEDTLRTAWMNIGTSDKEERKVSARGRVKTGAKGIGRFALDKLSAATMVYTKSNEDTLKKWQIDWRQFDTAIMLDEVSASIENCDGSYINLAEKIAKEKVKSFEQYSWNTGTVIVLSPIREKWSAEYFSKINRNLKSLFPSTNNSQFDIYVDNVFYPEYSFENERFSIDESDYDYKIFGSFDGKDTLTIKIDRNEIDTRKIKISVKDGEQKYDLMLNDFWSRAAFQVDGHRRADYAKQFTLPLSISSLTKIDPAIIASVGSFQAELYFLKNTKSTIEIVRPVVSSRRKDILANYSGIKLYRDGFKVRPYGEEGPSFDWIGLGERARKNPGAVSSDGPWRVQTNQIIGAVRISKDGNPELVDMANREGLAFNDAYRTFVVIIEKIVETFESDRQYVFHEYASWLKAKKAERSKTQELIEHIENEQRKASGTPKQSETPKEKADLSYSPDEYKDAVLDLKRENERKDRAIQTMMLYSSAGVMTNTFSHEISRITSNAGSRMQHLRYAVKRLVGENGYTGNPIFDPFIIIDQTEEVDKLLERWLEVIMSGAEQSAFSGKNTNVFNTIQKILDIWEPLLQQKLININPIKAIGKMEDCICATSEISLHIILNNFLLNSAWFLEKSVVKQREVDVTIENKSDKIIILLENNGPPLDGMFSNNPERIFFPGESSKKTEKGEGTGLGLWITKIVVDDSSGEIHPMDKEDGFGLWISLPK
ncbi:MAG: ATP-binding protein [Oscillospiraceae bacterium]|nr:ATP-binding protein [Oscillospiraceae bacterium]